MQNTQIDSILPVLRENKSKNIVFVINNPLGYEKYISAVGRERVMIGFPSAGGERKNGIVTYFVGRGIAKIIQSTTFGEIDGKNTQRLQTITKIFHNAGFDPAISKDMNAWQKTHVAFVVPIARALSKFESNNYKLARSRNVIRQMILATREGFKAIDDAGIEIEPKKLNYYYHLPIWLLVTLYQIVFNTKIAEYAMAKHTLVAMDEINTIDNQFRNMYKTSIFTNWNDLHQTTTYTE